MWNFITNAFKFGIWLNWIKKWCIWYRSTSLRDWNIIFEYNDLKWYRIIKPSHQNKIAGRGLNKKKLRCWTSWRKQQIAFDITWEIWQ